VEELRVPALQSTALKGRCATRHFLVTVKEAVLTFIPFTRLCPTGRELLYVKEAVEQMHTAGDGPFSRRCQALLERELVNAKVLLTSSGTHALDLAALLLDLQPGDEVLLPSFTFPSTANAFVLRGARPIFVDICPDTLNLDHSLLEARITPQTRVIVPMHYAGVGCEMDCILDLAHRYSLSVIEDNAHGLFGRYRGKPLGTLGTLSALSFHETKNYTCGEGGALVINNPAYIERAEILREKGTNRTRFFRGELDKYSWVDIGSSYLLSDILAAFLCAQLEARQRIQASRQKIWQRYYTKLLPWAVAHGVGLPKPPTHCDQSFHMFYLLLPSLESRRALMAHLKYHDILSAFHYVPLHLSAMGRKFGAKPGDCPVAESASDRLLRLPFYNELDQGKQDRVISAVQEFIVSPPSCR